MQIYSNIWGCADMWQYLWLCEYLANPAAQYLQTRLAPLHRAQTSLVTLHTLHTIHTIHTIHTLHTIHTIHTLHTIYTLHTLNTLYTLTTIHTSLHIFCASWQEPRQRRSERAARDSTAILSLTSLIIGATLVLPILHCRHKR